MIRGGSWLFFEKILLLGKGFLLTYLYANFLSRETYGEYQFVIAFLGALSIVALPGMGVAIVQALARNKDGIFSRAAGMMFRMAFWGSLVLVLSSGYYLYLMESDLARALLVTALIFPGYVLMNLWRYYYTGKSQFDLLVKASVVLEIISLLAALCAILFFPNLFGLVIFGIILPLPFSLLLVWRLCQKTRNLELDTDNVRFGKKLSYTVALSTFASYSDKLLLSHFLGFSELALYSISLIIPEQAKGAITSFMTPLLPQYSQTSDRKKLKEHVLFFVVASVLSALALYFLLPYLFELVFPQYIDGLSYARTLLLLLLLIPFTLLETFFRSQKKEKIVFRANLAGTLTAIILVFVLVPPFGIIGAILAKVGGQFIQGFSYILSYLRKDSFVNEGANSFWKSADPSSKKEKTV